MFRPNYRKYTSNPKKLHMAYLISCTTTQKKVLVRPLYPAAGSRLYRQLRYMVAHICCTPAGRLVPDFRHIPGPRLAHICPTQLSQQLV